MSGAVGHFLMSLMPGWNSLEGAQKWGNIFTMLGLVALAALVLFDVLAFVYGKREKQLNTARDAALATQREQQERAQIERSQAQIGDLSARLQTAEHSHTAAQKELAQSREKISKLEQRANPKTISAAQKAILGRRLKQLKGVHIEIDIMSSDPKNVVFGKKLAETLGEFGWTVQIIESMMIKAPGQSGLSVVFTDETTPAAGQLAIAFKEAGIIDHPLPGTKIEGGDILKLAVLPEVR